MAKTSAVSKQYRYARDKESLISRVKKVEGQARGIQRMIEEDRYCIDIIQQLTALSAAANEVSLLILQNHIEGCIAEAVREHREDSAIKELMDTLRKAIKW